MDTCQNPNFIISYWYRPNFSYQCIPSEKKQGYNNTCCSLSIILLNQFVNNWSFGNFFFHNVEKKLTLSLSLQNKTWSLGAMLNLYLSNIPKLLQLSTPLESEMVLDQLLIIFMHEDDMTAPKKWHQDRFLTPPPPF